MYVATKLCVHCFWNVTNNDTMLKAIGEKSTILNVQNVKLFYVEYYIL